MNRMLSTNTRIGVALAALCCATAASAEVILSDNFENRTTGDLLQLSPTSGPDTYTWHNVSSPPNGPVISEYNGNKYANLTNLGLTSASFSNLVLDSTQSYTLSFDLLWLHSYGSTEDSSSFFVYFNLPARYTNVPATNNVQGFRLGINPRGYGSVDYFIQQKTTSFVDIVRGNTNIGANVTTAGDTTPGAPVSVSLTWDASHLSLSVGGTVVYTSEATPFTPTAANANITGNTFLQFWTTTGRNKGLDNVVLSLNPASSVPEPATSAALIGGLVLAGGLLRRRR